MEKSDEPSFWWYGPLGDGGNEQAHHALVMTYRKNATVHATLVLSISDGTKAWTVSQTGEQMLSRSAASIVNVIEEVVRLLESGKASSLQVCHPASGSDVLRVVIKEAGKSEIARVELAEKDEVPMDKFVATLMSFLEFTGSKAVDAANDLEKETEGKEGAQKIMNEELLKRETFNAEISSQMRLLLAEKIKHCND